MMLRASDSVCTNVAPFTFCTAHLAPPLPLLLLLCEMFWWCHHRWRHRESRVQFALYYLKVHKLLLHVKRLGTWYSVLANVFTWRQIDTRLCCVAPSCCPHGCSALRWTSGGAGSLSNPYHQQRNYYLHVWNHNFLREGAASCCRDSEAVARYVSVLWHRQGERKGARVIDQSGFLSVCRRVKCPETVKWAFTSCFRDVKMKVCLLLIVTQRWTCFQQLLSQLRSFYSTLLLLQRKFGSVQTDPSVCGAVWGGGCFLETDWSLLFLQTLVWTAGPGDGQQSCRSRQGGKRRLEWRPLVVDR